MTRGDGGTGLFVCELGLPGAAGVAVRGELELATAPELTAALDHAIRHTTGPFVIDLSQVGFLDSTGIACLMRARALLGRDDRELALICPPGSARRALEVTGVDELVALYATRDELVSEAERLRAAAARPAGRGRTPGRRTRR